MLRTLCFDTFQSHEERVWNISKMSWRDETRYFEVEQRQRKSVSRLFHHNSFADASFTRTWQWWVEEIGSIDWSYNRYYVFTNTRSTKPIIYYLRDSLDIVKNFRFITERRENKSEWNWYEQNIVKYFENQLRLKNKFTSKQIHRAIGLINVNAVALQMPKLTHAKKGKGVVLLYNSFVTYKRFNS